MYSSITAYGPDEDDTVEHIKQAKCRTVNCYELQTYYDDFCERCRNEIDATGLREIYPPGRFKERK
jgi:hypothetical protein